MTTGTLLNQFDTEWVGVIHSTAPKFFRGYMDETIRNRILLSYLRRYGRILTGANAPVCVWNIKFDQQPITDAGDAGTLVFNRHDLQRQAALNWRGYVGTDAMTEKEYLMNQGSVQILNRYGEIIPSLMEAITDHFGSQLYVDGDAPGNENKIHGLESFLAADVANTVVADTIAPPADTYAGLSTQLGAEGGTWTAPVAGETPPNAYLGSLGSGSNWPNGQGPVRYDFFSPLLVNWSSNAWAASNGWIDTCERVIRQTIIWQTNRGGAKGRPKLLLIPAHMYTDYLNHHESKQRIIIPHTESERLGFADVINQEGVGIKYEFDVPTNTGYMINIENMELSSLDRVLFGYRGPDWSIRDRAYLFYVGFWGNMRHRVKHMAKLFNYKAS